MPFLFTETETIVFSLALIRITSFFFTWPLFSQAVLPTPVKVLFSVAVTACVFPVIDRSGVAKETLELTLMWLSVKEAFIGLFLGFLSRLLFFSVEFGGSMISTAMGLSSATVFNPASGSTSTIIERFYIVLLTLLILSLNVHHAFISALVESFSAVPIAPAGIDLAAISNQKGGGEMVQMVTIAGLKMSAPVMVVIFFLNVAMGIVGRAVPQINVLVTSLPVNIVAGLLVMIVTLPALILGFDRDLAQFADLLFKYLRAI